jgi:undecaprenyl-diphosphatase
MVITSAMTLALTDQLAANLLKDLIARPRPCHVLTDINLLVGCGAGYAMPSAHAANTFGQAVLFAIQFRVCRPWVIGFAVLVSISRTFVGVHYPGDIAAGALVGIVIGLATSRLHSLWVTRRFPHPGTVGEAAGSDPHDRGQPDKE